MTEVKKQVIVAPIGYTPNYKKVKYNLDNKVQLDWLSCRALMKLLNGENWRDFEVILIYPQNSDSENIIENGWTYEDGSRRPGLREIFRNNKQCHLLSVDDTLLLGEKHMFQLISDLHETILNIVGSDKLRIIYDLTHAYRHLNFGALLQSIMIVDFYRDQIEIGELYYALGKAPLNQGDELHYLKLSSFTEMVIDIGSISKAIRQLRPKEIYDLGKKYGQLAKRLAYEAKSQNRDPDFQFLQFAGTKFGEISNILTQLLIGQVSDRLFEDLQEILNERPVETSHHMELIANLQYQFTLEVLRKFIRKFYSKDGKLLPIWNRQLILAEIAVNQQLDIPKSYLFLREMIVSRFIEEIHQDQKDIRTSITRALKKGRKMLIEPKLRQQLNTQERELFEIINLLFEERNRYAHVYAGHDDLPHIDVAKRKKLLEKNLAQIKKMLTDQDGINAVSNFIREQMRQEPLPEET